MSRTARVDVGEQIYHVLNRAVMRLEIFKTKEDYLLFEELLRDAAKETSMRILAYTLMPNHWHLILHPRRDGDLALFMHRLTNAHTRQVHAQTGTTGTGPLYQGRYKSFIIQSDQHLLTVIKYVERNPARAKLVCVVQSWRWSSAWTRIYGTLEQREILSTSPVPLPTEYLSWVNTAEHSEMLALLRASVNKSAPYGKEGWVERMSTTFNLSSTLRNPGRPKAN